MIRPARPADAPALAALAIAFRDHLRSQRPSDAQFHENVARLLGQEDAEFLVAESEGRPVGYVLLRYRHSMWAAGEEATLEDLFVHPGARRGGHGRRLVEAALDRMRARGCATACLDTNERNEASMRIYGGLGFESYRPRWEGRQVFMRLELRGDGNLRAPDAPSQNVRPTRSVATDNSE